jgi:superfamily II DNA or RNA helicase
MSSATAASTSKLLIAPGAQILARDAVWRVVQVTPTFNGTHAYHVVGVSEIVRDQEAIFLEEFERTPTGELDITVLDPRVTEVVADDSSNHRAGLLYMEALLRDVPPTREDLHIGHRAAMDVIPYQLDPASQALKQLRARLLIADAVGLGKTLEAGILLSELIRRGRGRRILVVAVKSMLAQLQKELWTRFSIPLVRLDSKGLARVRQQLPTNHNPFHAFDRAIVSIDTLKEQGWFRAHVENARWDVIVIDEAHNVAVRGKDRSLRAKLAQTLADRSDELILLSATPHDGKARSFASLMNMLDPTAIANPDEYGPDDIRGLFIRRFKKDVQDQVRAAFPERTIAQAWADATPEEERAYAALGGLRFTRVDQGATAGQLFRTRLEKALLSSPAACVKTIDNRIGRLRKREDAAEFAGDVAQLEKLRGEVASVGPERFSKYQKLLSLIRDKKNGLDWSPTKKDDRLVIFTESLETLAFLEENLRRDLGLDANLTQTAKAAKKPPKKPGKAGASDAQTEPGQKIRQLEVLHGELPDTELQRIVEEFGKAQSALRVLVASDVASEGINLHFLSHKLVHFDVPWSLMKFRQRNGRIDRYGQTKAPQIVYLLTRATEPAIKGDHRILELLIERDEQATRNIGDPSAFGGVYDIDEEERRTAEAIERRLTPEVYERTFHLNEVDPLELLLKGGLPAAHPAPPRQRECLSLFPSDFDFFTSALDLLRESDGVAATVKEAERLVELKLPPDLARRYRKLPDEARPGDGVAVLCANPERIKAEIQDARAEADTWPRLQYLWALHPAMTWAADKVRFRFGRHTAPAIAVARDAQGGLDPDERVVVVSALLPNRRSQPLLHRWYGAVFRGSRLERVEDFRAVVDRAGLVRRKLANRGEPPLDELRPLVAPAVDAVRAQALLAREERQRDLDRRLADERERLATLRARQLEQLETEFMARTGAQAQDEKAARRRAIDRRFEDFERWVAGAMTTEPAPFLQVIAVLFGTDGGAPRRKGAAK